MDFLGKRDPRAQNLWAAPPSVIFESMGFLVPPWMEPKRAGQDCRNRRPGEGAHMWDSLLTFAGPYQISCVLQPAKNPTCAGPDQREGCDG